MLRYNEKKQDKIAFYDEFLKYIRLCHNLMGILLSVFIYRIMYFSMSYSFIYLILDIWVSIQL